ncbi:YlxR family protein [Nocardioides sp. W3-2-3]|nr:YlxR family protein [Nocardioides convexus]
MKSSARPDALPSTGPVRTCIGCRQRAAKCELLRLTAGSGTDGPLVVLPDPDASAPGRGAHLHPTTGCYDLAVRRKAFSRALRVTPGAGGLSTAPVGEYVASRTDPTDRNWSNRLMSTR